MLASCAVAALLVLASRSLAQDATVAPAEEAVVVKLLDAGSAPRREIRFTPKTGDQLTAVMTMDMQMKITIDGRQPPQATLPAQKMTMKVVVDDVKPNGDIAYSFSYTDIEVVEDPNRPSPAAATIRQMMKPLIGMKGQGVTTNRGLTKSGSIEVPPNAAPAIKQQMAGMKDAINQLSSPLPEEAVGVGARWSVVQKMEVNGLKLTQTSTHQLTGLTDDGFSVAITLAQNADPQELKNPTLPPNVKLKLKSLKTTGVGNSRVDVNKVLPLLADVAVQSDSEMVMEMAGQRQAMTTSTSVKTKIEQAETP